MERLIDVDETTTAVVIAVQGFFILFFVVSPMVGSVMHAEARKRKNSVLVLGIMLLLFNLIFAGLTFVLQRWIGTPALNQAIAISSVLLAALVSILVGWYLSIYARRGPSLMEQELRYLASRDPASLAPFERQRMETLKRHFRRKI